MKKSVKLLSLLAIVLGLVACGGKEPDPVDPVDPTPSEEEEEVDPTPTSKYDYQTEQLGFTLKEDGTYEVAKCLVNTNDEHDETSAESMVSPGTKVEIPAEVNGKKVTSIGKEAFFWSNVAEVTIPNTVTEICEYAFANARHIHEINIPASVTTFGKYAFYKLGCHTINYVIPANRSYVVFEHTDPSTIKQFTNFFGSKAVAAQGAVYARVPKAQLGAFETLFGEYVPYIEGY